MKLIDRYVLYLFLAALIVFFAAFLGLFIVIDFSTRLPKFLTLTKVPFSSFVLDYYLCRVPMFTMYVLPMLPLFASMFAMIKLQKTNEVLPIVASGMSLRRLTVPFVIASFVAAGFTAALDEFALPHLMKKIGDTDEILLTEEVSFSRVLYDGRNHVFVGSYDHVRKQMNSVVLSKFSPDLKLELVANARRCVWDDAAGRWILQEGSLMPYDADGKPFMIETPGESPRRRIDPIPDAGYALESKISPDDFKRKFSISGTFYTVREIDRRLAEKPGDPRLVTLREAKFSTPLSSVIILLLGLPLVVSPRGRSFFRGLTLCLLVTAAYYVVYLAGLEMGKLNRIPPIAAAWLAPGAFGLPGIVSWMRMRS